VDALLQKILDAATEKGGKITYPDFLTLIDYQERQLMPRTIRYGKSKKTLFSYLEYDTENKVNIHWLSTTAPINAENNAEA
jgi:hypothetical protein